jgi:hypothetical protein
MREQAELYRGEPSKLLTVDQSPLQDDQEHDGLAMEELNQTITELEAELRRARAEPRIALAPLGLESRETRRIPKRTFKLSDRKAESEPLAEERNKILRRRC